MQESINIKAHPFKNKLNFLQNKIRFLRYKCFKIKLMLFKKLQIKALTKDLNNKNHNENLNFLIE
jgi:hypothetical protein